MDQRWTLRYSDHTCTGLVQLSVFILIFHRIECHRGEMHPSSPNLSSRSKYRLPLTYDLRCRRPLYRMSLPQEAIDIFNPVAPIKILFARSHLFQLKDMMSRSRIRSQISVQKRHPPPSTRSFVSLFEVAVGFRYRLGLG